MPLFEFFCKNCDNIISDITSFNTEEIICQNCGKTAKKILSESNWSMKCECTNPIPPVKIKEIENKKQNSDNKRLLRDLICEKCDNVDERFIYDSELENQICEKCGGHMKSIPTYTSFKLKYSPKTSICDWEGNSTQYWNAVKEERRKGKDVKPLGSD